MLTGSVLEEKAINNNALLQYKELISSSFFNEQKGQFSSIRKC